MQKCTCAGASLRSKKYVPLNCINLDTATDPCSGSGHILEYMFDVLMKIYESYGYTTREAVASIVENNLYGLDIDDRAAQLAYFVVMMKARQYDRRFFNQKDDNGNIKVLQPHVHAVVESGHTDKNGKNIKITMNICLSIFVMGMKNSKLLCIVLSANYMMQRNMVRL